METTQGEKEMVRQLAIVAWRHGGGMGDAEAWSRIYREETAPYPSVDGGEKRRRRQTAALTGALAGKSGGGRRKEKGREMEKGMMIAGPQFSEAEISNFWNKVIIKKDVVWLDVKV
uniref:Uncharacterized protein n=1 Tax=Oryza nivara TaxID=4536 RepID=A0A0E0FFB6_ORYNI